MARRTLKPGQLPTSDLVVETAARWFGDVGFDGLSLRDLGATLGVTAPTLLHHVGSKRKLYARVLAHVAGSVSEAIGEHTRAADHDDTTQVTAFLDAYLAWSRAHAAYARLLMRELLDNNQRAARGRYWPLAPLVELVTAHVHHIRGGTRLDAAMTVFQSIGAIAYYAAAEPTMRQVLGASEDLDEAFRAAMHRTLRSTLRRQHARARSNSRTRLRGARRPAESGRARRPAGSAATAPARPRRRP